jgi:hypothetical protein
LFQGFKSSPFALHSSFLSHFHTKQQSITIDQCHEVFKKRVPCVCWGDLLLCENPADATENPDQQGYFLKCGCGSRLSVVGPAFEAPPKNKIKEWERAKKIIQAGYVFSPCECFKVKNKNALKKMGVESLEEVK